MKPKRALAMWLWIITHEKVNEETWGILKRLDLVEMVNMQAENLSHGHQRILEIALAMAGNAKILFLDEPTAGMSSGETEHIASLIKGLSDVMSVVLIEHDMNLVMSISDEITVLNQGKIVAEGSPEEIQLNDKVKEAYLGTE